MPILLVIIGAPILIFSYVFGSSAPQSPAPQQAPVASSSPSPGALTSYASLPAVPATAPSEPGGQSAGEERQTTPSTERETLYVAGHKVPLRAEPDARGRILDRCEPGQIVQVLGRRGEWTHVRHGLTQREGWIQAKRLRDEPSAAEAEHKPQPAKISPAITVAAIARLLIEQSIASYPGPCACPYQSARNGSSCGKRAAYVRPGGYSPLCFAKDVTLEMVAAYRAGH